MGVLGHKRQYVQDCTTITSQEYMSFKCRYFGADMKKLDFVVIINLAARGCKARLL